MTPRGEPRRVGVVVDTITVVAATKLVIPFIFVVVVRSWPFVYVDIVIIFIVNAVAVVVILLLNGPYYGRHRPYHGRHRPRHRCHRRRHRPENAWLCFGAF